MVRFIIIMSMLTFRLNAYSQKIDVKALSPRSIEYENIHIEKNIKMLIDDEAIDIDYNLKTYNNKRSWNNSEGWANPENFDKYRW